MGYVIKVTYTSGEHAGHSYLLLKGGYSAYENEFILEDRQYKTKAIAEGICKKYFANNEQEYAIERKSEEWKLAHGKKPSAYFIYEHKTYEPYEVK